MQSQRLSLIAFSVITWLSGCWTQNDLRICFKETEQSSQCLEGISQSCSGFSSNPDWTDYFRDDTDDRPGGCEYQWRIERYGTLPVNQEYRLCFQETEGSSQCQLSRSSCTEWSSNANWTAPFHDDTDDRSGGCKYQWKIESQDATDGNKYEVCRICFKETEGSSQCQLNRESCSGWTTTFDPIWTAPFRDDTDDRSGGCEYQWYLDCASLEDFPSCPNDKPC